MFILHCCANLLSISALFGWSGTLSASYLADFGSKRPDCGSNVFGWSGTLSASYLADFGSKRPDCGSNVLVLLEEIKRQS